jgi:hypothetical protein
MKKCFLVAVFIALTLAVTAQKIRLNGYTNYVFDDQFNSYYDPYNYYEGKIKGGFQWGAGVEYMINPNYCIELMYLNQATTAPVTYQGGIGFNVKNETFDVNFNSILLGVDGHFVKPGSKVEGYAGFFGGVAIIDIDNPATSRSESTSEFAWLGRLGCNIWPGGKVGIKLQAQIYSVAQAVGGGFYFGGGAGVGLSSYSTIFQFGLGGGLTFRLGN